jgi:hypothetical protein
LPSDPKEELYLMNPAGSVTMADRREADRRKWNDDELIIRRKGTGIQGHSIATESRIACYGAGDIRFTAAF